MASDYFRIEQGFGRERLVLITGETSTTFRIRDVNIHGKPIGEVGLLDKGAVGNLQPQDFNEMGMLVDAVEQSGKPEEIDWEAFADPDGTTYPEASSV